MQAVNNRSATPWKPLQQNTHFVSATSWAFSSSHTCLCFTYMNVTVCADLWDLEVNGWRQSDWGAAPLQAKEMFCMIATTQSDVGMKSVYPGAIMWLVFSIYISCCSPPGAAVAALRSLWADLEGVEWEVEKKKCLLCWPAFKVQ